MKLVKINELVQNHGMCDYKGLDVQKIVTGTQLYPSFENAAYFEYDGDVITSGDIEEITPEVYEAVKRRMEEERPISPELEIERLKQEDLNNKEAIAELYLMTMGGM